MSYFYPFPKTLYSFGDGEVATIQNISLYADIIDDIKNNGAFYQSYYIKTGERPDNLAFKLYENAELHWLFYLMNDNIKNRGWPVTYNEVLEKCKIDFPGVVIRTHDNLAHKFKVGQNIKGNTSGARGTIVYRDLKLGHIVLDDVTGTFYSGELLTTRDNLAQTITSESVSPEHLAARYYIDSNGEIVDYDPFTGPGELITKVTQLDYYVEQNDELRQIRVLKPAVANQVVQAFRDAMRS